MIPNVESRTDCAAQLTPVISQAANDVECGCRRAIATAAAVFLVSAPPTFQRPTVLFAFDFFSACTV